MFNNGDKVQVSIPNSNLEDMGGTVIGLSSHLPEAGGVYIVQLDQPHSEAWNAYCVPQTYLTKKNG